MQDSLNIMPAAFYACVSSDRKDVDLSVAAQLRALRDFAQRNGYVVAREYIDEAEWGRVANRRPVPHGRGPDFIGSYDKMYRMGLGDS